MILCISKLCRLRRKIHLDLRDLVNKSYFKSNQEIMLLKTELFFLIDIKIFNDKLITSK